jgi:hypothetical protein
MKKLIILIVTGLIILIQIISGCQEQSANANKKFKGISLDSDIVELYNASLEYHTRFLLINKSDLYPTEVIEKVDVKYLLHNIAGKNINVSIIVYFYDKDNKLLTQKPDKAKTIYLFKDYTERTFTPANIISYSGSKVTEVDHVKIVVTEI